MIAPVKKGQELLAEIRDTRPGASAMAMWWLGQSGFLIKSSQGTLLIDPYLSEHLTAKYEGTAKPHIRMTEAPLRGGDLIDTVDLILASHKHSDHIDPGTLPPLMEASPAAQLVVPRALLNHARSLGLPKDRVHGITAGETFEHAGFSVRAIPSAHEGLDTDDDGQHLYLGFVVETAGKRVYHSGDSMLYEGLTDWLGADAFDILFLPINGKDPARGVSGNMNAAEAVDLAVRVQPRFLVPHHYDMFTFNTVPVASFEAQAARLSGICQAVVLRCAQRWEI